jgi:Tfp pilus assembly protein PilF
VSFHGFINYDDPLFVLANSHVYTGVTLANVRWAFTTLNGDATSYQPLVWLTHQLDCQFFGLRAGPQHLTNLWLHVANAILLFTLLDKLTGEPWRSAVVAALFGLHPLHVETVAWISERKTLVCTFFWLLTTLAYLRYVRRGGTRSYLLVLLLFAAALLCKPIAVSLPITLLLLDFWPLARFRLPQTAPGKGSLSPQTGAPNLSPEQLPKFSGRGQRVGTLLLEKAPLLLLSGLACLVTVLAQADLGATKSLAEVPMRVRLSNSIVAYVLYLRKLVWPADLAPIYPLRYDWVWWQVAASGLLLLSMSLLAAAQARRRPYLMVGWSWYLVTLFPTLGLVQVGSQGMADRYSYVPLTGVFLLVVWEVSERTAGLRHRRAVLGIGAAAVTVVCALCTIVNIQYWEGTARLFEHAASVTKNNDIAHQMIGIARQSDGNLRGAETEYRESLRIDPNRAPTHTFLGVTLFQEGDSQGAFEQYSLALKLKPKNALAHRQLAELLLRSTDARFHDPRKALEHAWLACEFSHYRKRDFVAFLAQVCMENHETQQAADAAQKALALSVSPQEIQGAMELAADISRMAAVKNDGTAPRSTETQ